MSGSSPDPPPAGSAPFLVVAGLGVMPQPSALELLDARVMARGLGITPEEAAARYVWQLDFGAVVEEVSAAHPDIYSSASLNPPGWVGGVIWFTERPPQYVLDLVASLPVPSRVHVDASYNQAQIELISGTAGEAFRRILGTLRAGWSLHYDNEARAVVLRTGPAPGLSETSVAHDITAHLEDHLLELTIPAVQVHLGYWGEDTV